MTATTQQPQWRAHLLRTGPRRGLARTVRPVQDETIDSYLRRLAAANRITTTDLLTHLGGVLTTKITRIDLGALAVLSRHPPHVLAYAIPQLRAPHRASQDTTLRGRTVPGKPNIVRPGCRRCMATRGITQPVGVWTRHDQNICLRHQLWIGGAVTTPGDQVDLTGHPDIVHAQIRHTRLLRHHDHRLVKTCYALARQLLDDLTHRGYQLPYFEARDLRQTAHFHNRPWRISYNDPIHHAVNYPEAITLTELLTSPRWRPFALSRSTTDHHRFHTEFWRRLPTHYPITQPHLPNFRCIMLWTTPSQWTPHLHPTESHQPAE